jgi:P27 family predicted phage terminase small subunit
LEQENMGRNKKPVAYKFQHGSYYEERDGEPLPTPAGIPDKPAWLSPVAATVWDAVVAELAETPGLLTPLDGPALACYCLAWQRLHEAREIIAREGLLVDGKDGTQRRHPATMIEAKALEQISSIGGKFGLTPTSRASLGIDPKHPDDDELERLLR